MEAATVFRASPLTVARPPNLAQRPRVSALGGATELFRPNSGFGRIKTAQSLTHSKQHIEKAVTGRRRSSFVVRASSSSDSAGSISPVAPLQLESPVGQFLSQILTSHPHLVTAAVEQQLEQLQTELDAEKQKEEPASSGTDLVLYRRIAEVKSNERKKALEEILYALIVKKFMDANISLVPSISSSSTPSGRVDTWPGKVKNLEQIHSPEAYEMIQNHLALILGNRLGDSTSIAEISKLRVGQVYAASIMYGYFLKRVDQRFQLEKVMKTLPEGRSNNVVAENGASTHPEVSDWAGGVSPGGFGFGMGPSRLKSYVMSFDADTLQRCATIRSKEAIGIIEKHTEALFGRPEIGVRADGTIDASRDEVIRIGFDGLKRLVLEAVTFGSFLWDVESHVDSRYRFVMN